MSASERKAHNDREEKRIRACQAEDEDELLRRVDAAGPKGYSLPQPNTDDGIRMLIAAQRLASNPNKFKPLMPLTEREPFVMVRRKRDW